MKKLAFLFSAMLGLLLMAASFKASCKNPTRLTDTNTVIAEKSLNGIPYAAANKMIQAAQVTNVDPTPANTQIWFSKQVITAVYNLLMHEDSVGIVKPDGIRVYFASGDTTNAAPTHFNNGIVVVSTYRSGVIQIDANHRVNIHTDYFEHDVNSALFNIRSDSLSGLITHDNDATSGSMLYNTCNCDSLDTCVTSSNHFIKRSDGEALVHAFQGQAFKAKSEWFDINMLINLYYEMQCSDEDGIRIYFARGTARESNLADVGKARFVIVTTEPKTNSINNALVPIHKDRFDCYCTIKPTATLSQKAVLLAFGKKAAAVKQIKNKKNGGGNDNGELCPNNCNGQHSPKCLVIVIE
ncbi:MAG TPA: hypothetical protein VFE53_08220 [Mucilaginibacter sp.]|jgi:hypothetical protein|nr:hypothetical protein [Mucilaginibacter sp.]